MNKKTQTIKMQKHIDVESQRVNDLVSIKLAFLQKKISREKAREKMNAAFEYITAKEFAVSEQLVREYGIDDDVFTKSIDDIFFIMDGLIELEQTILKEGHPIRSYQDEIKAIHFVLDEIKDLMKKKYIKNQWLEIYDKLIQIKIHFSRKQNQLYTKLEEKGFDRPSRIMWTVDNQVRDIVSEAAQLLKLDKVDEFISLQPEVIEKVTSLFEKETEILYPTSLEMISDDEFLEMSAGDREIGYCLIPTPPLLKLQQQKEVNASSNDQKLVNEIASVLKKFSKTTGTNLNEPLKVATGELTLEQINLIYKHLPVDISYVDENDIMKFYTDTSHRVFPRSPGVIGRHVENCHPRESVEKVQEIIESFRSGKQDTAEFWLDMGEKFVYIVYKAVKDETGKFRGILEMMQDIKRIKTLSGSQKLVSWGKSKMTTAPKDPELETSSFVIAGKTILADLVNQYPFTKKFLTTLTPKFKKLNNPLIYKTMSKVATLDMIAARGDLESDYLINQLVLEVEREKNK